MTLSENSNDIIIRNEIPTDGEEVENLGAKTFGPGRFSRSAFRLREGVAFDPALSFVAICSGAIAGSVRLTPIFIGNNRALVLGPLMISPSYRNLGVGRELMMRSLKAASVEGHQLIVLVGDYCYYKSFNFIKVPQGQIVFPGPADPDRILACQLNDGSLTDFHGETMRDFGA